MNIGFLEIKKKVKKMIKVELTNTELFALESAAFAALLEMDKLDQEEGLKSDDNFIFQELRKARSKLSQAMKEKIKENKNARNN